MTSLTDVVDRLAPHFEACAQAGANEIEAAPVRTGNVVKVDDPTPALPLGGVRLLVGSVAGPFELDVVLALADTFASRLGGSGPPLIAETTPALRAVVRGLSVLTDLAFDLGDVHEVPLGTPWGDPGTQIFTAGLFVGEEQVGNVIFLVPPGAAIPADAPPAEISLAAFPDAGADGAGDEDDADASPLAMLRGVEMRVTAELGRTRLPVAHLLELGSGSVVELDRVAGAPVDVLVNGTVIARGEVVVVDEEYGVRITEILGVDEV